MLLVIKKRNHWMKTLDFSVSIKCGNSRRKVEDINLSFGGIKCCGEKAEWSYRVFALGNFLKKWKVDWKR